ncbi:MAG: hypothetical protein MUF36_12970 [Bacteroidales bacterium]|nr:hypothetical protein [Bacteroidales bacterium]
MKEKDLVTDCPYQQVVLYAEKGDGTFGPFQTGSYMAGVNISEHFRITENLSRALVEQLKSGKISPVYYFMMIEGLTVPELAGRMGISSFRVKKHLTPDGFRKMRISTLKRYTDILNIPLANMFQIINTIEDRNWDMGYPKIASISQTKTDNPLVIETKIIQDKK